MAKKKSTGKSGSELERAKEKLSAIYRIRSVGQAARELTQLTDGPWNDLHPNCMTCHTDRKFKDAYGAGPSEMVRRVRAHPGSEHLSPEEAERVGAAMILARCTTCHGEEIIGELALRTHDDRLRYVRKKVRESRPIFHTNEVPHVMWALDVLYDEPYRRVIQEPLADPTSPADR